MASESSTEEVVETPEKEESSAVDADVAPVSVRERHDSQAPGKRGARSSRAPLRSAGLADKQATVRRGVILGMVGYAAILGLSYAIAPTAPAAASTADRIAYGVSLLPFSAGMLLAGIAAVANERYASDAIDPLLRAERGAIIVHGRYVENTLQQFVLHAVAVLGLAAEGSPFAMRMLPGLVACFVIGRAAFWMGYLRDALSRGPGFTVTLQPTVLALLFLVAKGAYTLVSR
jgi:hypothetical protein